MRFCTLKNIKKKNHIAYNTININNLYYIICIYLTDKYKVCMHNSIISLFKRFDTRCGYHRCHRSSVVIGNDNGRDSMRQVLLQMFILHMNLIPVAAVAEPGQPN